MAFYRKESAMKICFICDILKPLNQFYRHKKMKDGHLGKCKKCCRKQAREHGQLSHVKKRDRKRGILPHRIQAHKKYAKTKRGKERLAAGSKAWIKRNPEKRKAHIAMNNALRDGKLIKQPCKCGETKVHGHHEDYSKPLEVIWLCSKCHRDQHRAQV